jgi:uncharacterized lipoprotein YajG
MLKKLILVVIASILFITGCQNVKSVNLNKMVLNNSKIKSSESRTTASLDLTYDKKKVYDKDLLKVLDLFNHAKFDIQTKMQNSSTASLSGNLILQQGKIPFKMYLDSKAMVVSLDNATKPIRIPMEDGSTQDTKLLQYFQSKILVPTVRNLPNPKHISVSPKTISVHGTKINGYNVHAEIYANEAPALLINFIDNLLKDQNAISQIVYSYNKLNNALGDSSKLTMTEFKDGLNELKDLVNESLPDLKNLNMLSSKNYFKTDILVDKSFFVRKSSSTLNLGSIDDGSGLTGVRMQVANEVWNLNKPIKADKIAYKKYLNEDASAEEFLATLDKKRSVLYSVITTVTYEQSAPLKKSQVFVTNNKRKADTVVVKVLKKGDVVRVYNASKKQLLGVKEVAGTTVIIPVSQLGKKYGKIYVSVTRSHMAESAPLAVAFRSEK